MHGIRSHAKGLAGGERCGLYVLSRLSLATQRSLVRMKGS
jgi:hypothetical protein